MTITIGTSTYRVERLDGTRREDANGYDLRPVYRLTGKRGAELWATRLMRQPEVLILWNARTSSAAHSNRTLTDAGGTLAVR